MNSCFFPLSILFLSEHKLCESVVQSPISIRHDGEGMINSMLQMAPRSCRLKDFHLVPESILLYAHVQLIVDARRRSG